MFESGAILLYLGEKTGKFLPKPLVERIPVYEWLMWQMGGFGPMPGQVHHFIALENETDRAYGLKRYMAETRRLYGVLDRRLANHEFVADALSVADFAILGWAWRHPRHKVELKDFPNVERWYNALMARPHQARHGSQAGLVLRACRIHLLRNPLLRRRWIAGQAAMTREFASNAIFTASPQHGAHQPALHQQPVGRVPRNARSSRRRARSAR